MAVVGAQGRGLPNGMRGYLCTDPYESESTNPPALLGNRSPSTLFECTHLHRKRV